MSYKIFCLGNPLLDVQVRDGEALLKKYDLVANDAILAEEKHQPLYVNSPSPSFPRDRHSRSVATRKSSKTIQSRTSLEERPRTLRVGLL